MIRNRSSEVRSAGLSLVELLVFVAIAASLAAVAIPAFWETKRTFMSGRCVNSLRQLTAATHLYLQDHNGIFFPYYEDMPNGDRRWYFGTEKSFQPGSPEGNREIDVTQSPLHPYILSTGQVEICPAFPYQSKYWKPKFRGASFGYGYNIFLSPLAAGKAGPALRPTPISLFTLDKPGSILLFGDCAQVNSFQPPATANNPLIEEFYYFDDTAKTVHFRHGRLANLAFVDGHVEAFTPWPGTTDTRIPGETVGRITPRGSDRFLREP